MVEIALVNKIIILMKEVVFIGIILVHLTRISCHRLTKCIIETLNENKLSLLDKRYY